MRLPKRSLVSIIHDVIMASLSLPIAYYMRLGDAVWKIAPMHIVEHFLLFIVCYLAALFGFSMHREVWRYVSINELKTIAKVITVSVAISYAALFMVQRLADVPRSVPVIQWMTLGAMLSSSRIGYRLLRESHKEKKHGKHHAETMKRAIPVVILGANDHAEGFIRAMQRSAEAPYRVIAVLDKKSLRDGRSMRGVPIFYLADDHAVLEAMKRLEDRGLVPQRMIIAQEHMDHEQAVSVLSACDMLGIGLARLPRLTDFQQGVDHDIKPIAIEDLLGRVQSSHDIPAMDALLRGATVLITGAGGSIGSELVRHIVQHQPKHVVLVEQNEYHLYLIDKELMQLAPAIPRTALVADVRDAAHIERIFALHQPHIVFHAAALKHVPLAEINPEQTILTNVFGTQIVARACVRHKVQAMVLISTDKAVHPANVMGATKRLAEYVWMHETRYADAIKVVMVRFGNVLGSTGSVVPLFQEQLRAGGPLTVTHPDMERYFMTIREAAGLVIQAAAIAHAGASLYVLDMGTPMKIVHLAEQMIRLAGYRPYEEIDIHFTGLRAGEKLTEELVYHTEALQPTTHPKIRRSDSLAHVVLDDDAMDELYHVCHAYQPQKSRFWLQRLVQEYNPELAKV
ncbi:MAG: polysaccharide biosynthesis protein [Alphaproteobacteria bacterium]|nr:MAG: polysaccharide biosynthesis protein [Alphaproteobacteria bacterium]TAF15588.1 MAG: polysaccharide biosynthesis protein [Alphaproteobacteria bacterium]TAF41992.1 MAG: polysaccharide biosynthesis protein [Alphaproteobacteria bacterium]TAF76600.1 MAG: polysaccharide biosynthesis protein [Alphaproteobacteria bacterium]